MWIQRARIGVIDGKGGGNYVAKPKSTSAEPAVASQSKGKICCAAATSAGESEARRRAKVDGEAELLETLARVRADGG